MQPDSDTAKIDTKASPPYARRFPVAYIGNAGTFQERGRTFRIWKYMTFHRDGAPAVAAQFEGLAPVDEKGFLRLDQIREGLIVVKPGLLYRKIPMTGTIMAEHLRFMKAWKRPSPLVAYEIDKSTAAVDMGEIDLSGISKH